EISSLAAPLVLENGGRDCPQVKGEQRVGLRRRNDVTCLASVGAGPKHEFHIGNRTAERSGLRSGLHAHSSRRSLRTSHPRVPSAATESYTIIAGRPIR